MELRSDPSYIESVLQKYGFQKIKSTPNGFLAICVFHEDTHPSFSISNTGLWLCWACGVKGNLKQLHKQLGDGELDWKETLRVMGTQMDLDRFSHKPRRKKNATPKIPKDFEAYSTEEKVPPAIRERLGWPTIFHFGLGSCNTYPNKDRCIIPIRYKNRGVGYHGRALKAAMQPKYYNPRGIEIKEYVFNYDSVKKGTEIIVTEGAFNAMSMWEKGFKQTIATFGTQFKSEQIKKIFELAPSSIVICFDRDESRAGQKAAIKFGKIVGQVIDTYIMPLPVGRDPNDLPAHILEKCYSRKVRFDSLCES